MKLSRQNKNLGAERSLWPLALLPEAAERFQREAQIAGRLKSPPVVDILDFGRTTDGRFYLVMELLAGQSLHRLIEREGRLPPARVIGLLRQVLQGLQAAHAAGITH